MLHKQNFDQFKAPMRNKSIKFFKKDQLKAKKIDSSYLHQVYIAKDSIHTKRKWHHFLSDMLFLVKIAIDYIYTE